MDNREEKDCRTSEHKYFSHHYRKTPFKFGIVVDGGNNEPKLLQSNPGTVRKYIITAHGALMAADHIAQDFLPDLSISYR
jgi:hypothetical protein